MGDAVSIEWAFDHLLGREVGSRGGPNDADMFRVGDPKSLAVLLVQAADAIEKRARNAGVLHNDSESGSSDARIESAVAGIRQEAAELRKRSRHEGETYQWRLIGNLVSIIAALMESLEAP